ncbi:MAG: hypothetical protein ABNH16_17230 [Thalassolituus sp.]|jgi:hypothetical protein
MADFELEDSQGNRYRIRRGAGPQFWHTENLAGGSTLLADELLCNVPVSSIDAAHNHFYSDVLTSLPNRQSSPQGALSDALSSSHLTIEKIGTALVISDDVPDPRNELIVKIRNALATIVAGERAEAAMHTRLLDEENTLTKSMIYTGAFMQGIGSSAWGMVVWLKEVSDVVNPFVKMQHHAKALQAAWESEDFSKTYADTYVKGEKRELVEALGFDPTTITEQQIDEAMAMTSLVMDDPNVRGMLYQFTKDYAEAQHAIEVTNVIGSAVFEIILAIVMAAVTGGVGVVAAVGSKAHLIKKFQKVGDLLQDFAKATRSLKSQAKKRKTKGNQNAALPVEKVEAKKTDAHGAEDGKVSTSNFVPASDGQTDTLYRRDSRGPEEIFEEGFKSRRPEAEVPLEDYVDFNVPSQYVGTSKVPAGAAEVNTQTNKPGYLYEIDNPGGGIDVNKAYPDNPFAHEQEIAFKGKIDPCNIKGCTPLDGSNQTIGDFIENPNYAKGLINE